VALLAIAPAACAPIFLRGRALRACSGLPVNLDSACGALGQKGLAIIAVRLRYIAPLRGAGEDLFHAIPDIPGALIPGTPGFRASRLSH
jgi:hypothetical protein